MHLKNILFFFISIWVVCKTSAQEFIPLWQKEKMPNSKGLEIKDSIVNERALRGQVWGYNLNANISHDFLIKTNNCLLFFAYSLQSFYASTIFNNSLNNKHEKLRKRIY